MSFFKVCVELTGFTWDLRKKIKFSLKFLTDTQRPNLKNSIKRNDTIKLEEIFTKILQKSDLFTSYQKQDLMEEDENFDEIVEVNKTINFVINMQIVFVIIISLIQIWRIKNIFI